ncbi:MAG: Riboflavin biosynthesis protein RibF [Candidatus Marinimicrobia bacterium]|nr:Riboflavin biosynthesis protein RibF [Candidatus Neomarinimicrobiota bacterium]
MEFHNGLGSLPELSGSVVTIGSFDGVHRGHKRLISQVETRAKALQVPSILFTFSPHPKEVLLRGKKVPVELLTTTSEKKKIFQSEFEIDHIVIVPFTQTFSQIRAYDFLRDYLVDPCNPEEIIIGCDHSFGQGREGDAAFLHQHESEFGYQTEVINEVQLSDGSTVSSSRIREFVTAGNTVDAIPYLTRPYQVEGQVRAGDKRGQKMDFPTANITVPNEHKLFPQDGVYLVYVTGDTVDSYGMCNIGYRPTFDGKTHTLEVHLLTDPLESLYGETLTVHFFHRLRQEQEFESADDLIEQLQKDKSQCKNIIADGDPWEQYQKEQ